MFDTYLAFTMTKNIYISLNITNSMSNRNISMNKQNNGFQTSSKFFRIVLHQFVEEKLISRLLW